MTEQCQLHDQPITDCPWEVTCRRRNELERAARALLSRKDESPSEDAHIFAEWDDLRDALANILSSATQMYEALLRAEAAMSYIAPRYEKAEYLETLEQVRAALAKARGENDTMPNPWQGGR